MGFGSQTCQPGFYWWKDTFRYQGFLLVKQCTDHGSVRVAALKMDEECVVVKDVTACSFVPRCDASIQSQQHVRDLYFDRLPHEASGDILYAPLIKQEARHMVTGAISRLREEIKENDGRIPPCFYEANAAALLEVPAVASAFELAFFLLVGRVLFDEPYIPDQLTPIEIEFPVSDDLQQTSRGTNVDWEQFFELLERLRLTNEAYLDLRNLVARQFASPVANKGVETQSITAASRPLPSTIPELIALIEDPRERGSSEYDRWLSFLMTYAFHGDEKSRDCLLRNSRTEIAMLLFICLNLSDVELQKLLQGGKLSSWNYHRIETLAPTDVNTTRLVLRMARLGYIPAIHTRGGMETHHIRDMAMQGDDDALELLAELAVVNPGAYNLLLQLPTSELRRLLFDVHVENTELLRDIERELRRRGWSEIMSEQRDDFSITPWHGPLPEIP